MHRHPTTRPRRVLAAVAAAGVLAGVVVATGPAAPAAAADTTLTPVGAPFARSPYGGRLPAGPTSSEQYSSPVVADVTGDGAPEVVAAGNDGIVRVWDTRGTLVRTIDVSAHPITGTPAVGDLDRDGVADLTVTTQGNVVATYSLRGGTVRTIFRRVEPAAVVPGPTGFFSSPALADLDGDGWLDVVVSSWGQTLHVYSGRTLQPVPGWPKWLWDTLWSSPAVGDVDADGLLDVVVGGDCEGSGRPQPCYGTSGGGYVWAFNRDGSEKWRSFFDQVVWSSPALVDLNRDGAQDVVVGTGHYFASPRGHQVVALDGRTGRRLWSAPTLERVTGSPAVADVDGDGRSEVFVVGRGAELVALRADGSRLWTACLVGNPGRCPAGYGTHGGASVADVDADGQLEVLTQVDQVMRVYEARTGRLERTAPTNAGVTVFSPSSAPTVAQVNGVTWVLQTAQGDLNRNLQRDPGDELLLLAWQTGHPLGAAPWPTARGDLRRTGAVPLPAIDPVQARRYVSALYQDFLGRPATAAEQDHWAGRLVRRELSRYQLTTILSSTDEWVGVVVTRFYRDTLGREPDAAGLAGWVRAIRGGTPVAQVASAFYASPEYYQRIGGGNDRAWVSDLYRKLLLREPDRAGLDGWTTALRGGMSRTQLAHGFYQSPESVNTRIDTLYRSFLGRASDAGGRAGWSPMVRAHGDLVLAAALAASPEYWARSQTR